VISKLLSTFSARHLVFLVVLAAATVPLLLNIRLTHTASDETKRFYTNIDSLPSGSVVLMSFDFEASAFAEIKPLAEAVISHCFRRNLRIVGLSLFAEGTALGEQTLSRIAREKGRAYGTDYVYLGFRPQYTSAILAIGESLPKEFPTDYFGTPTESMPVLSGVTNYDQIATVISITDGGMPTYWVDYAVTRYHARLQTVLTATMATSFYPYISSGQIQALIAGLKGAAEYELLLNESGGGARGLLAQSVSQIAILAIIIAGNVVGYFGKRRKWQ
jgi:hypothetical protein